MRWLYLYVTHDPRGFSHLGAPPTRSRPSPRDPATDLPPIRPGAFARWAAAATDAARSVDQPLAPRVRSPRLRLANQLR